MNERNPTREKRDFLARIKEARIGDFDAQYDVALMFANGVGIKKDLDQALIWAEAAAERGHPSAQYLLGSAYQQGLGTPRDLKKALTWFLKASEKGNDKAALKLAKTYAEPQELIAFNFALEAAQKGLAEAQLTVGDYFARGFGVGQDFSKACMWYQLAASQGVALAQYALGRAHELGEGLDKDMEHARQWYRDAASQGLPAAQLALSRLDHMGFGREGDVQKSNKRPSVRERRTPDARWIKYATKGNTEDFFHLGEMFEVGAGVEKSVKQARGWFEKAAEQGHAGAMEALGRLLSSIAPVQAAYWYIKAAELGKGDAQYAVGQAMMQGLGVEKNALEALYWHVLAARQGNTSAQFAVAKLLTEVPTDLTGSLIQAAAQGGIAGAQFLLGQRYAIGEGVRQDAYLACQWYRLAAEQEHAEAQCVLASHFAEGKGVKKDRSKSFFWYEKAANQGNPQAQWNLGEIYAVGIPSVKPDPKKAMLLCKRSAKAGFAPAQATLGTLFAKAKKYIQAAQWWGLAAQQGDLEALFNLSRLCRSGLGVEKNDEKAFELLVKAAAGGLAAAQSGVGLAYATGNGAVLDVIEAAKWFVLAAKNGDKAATANLDKAKLLLSPSQWVEATRRAQVWAPSVKDWR